MDDGYRKHLFKMKITLHSIITQSQTHWIHNTVQDSKACLTYSSHAAIEKLL